VTENGGSFLLPVGMRTVAVMERILDWARGVV